MPGVRGAVLTGIVNWAVIINSRSRLSISASTATRDTQQKSIEWYNYAGDQLVRTSPTDAESSYTKTNARTDFYSVSGHLEWSHLFADVHDVKVMVGSQYNMKEYE